MSDGYFDVLQLHRDDLSVLIPDKAKRDAISDDAMCELARKLGDALIDDFFPALRVLVYETDIITK